MHRILITGGRDLPEAEVVWVPLWLALHEHEAIIVTHGACPAGADLYASEWLRIDEQAFNRKRRRYEDRANYLAIEDAHPADWSKGKLGGAIRNQEMVNLNPDVVLAFPTPKSRGTWDCIARAWVRGIPTFIYHHLDINRRRRLEDYEGEKLARRILRWGR